MSELKNLILTRHESEGIYLLLEGEVLAKVTIVEARRGKGRVSIMAPDKIKIVRTELVDQPKEQSNGKS